VCFHGGKMVWDGLKPSGQTLSWTDLVTGT